MKELTANEIDNVNGGFAFVPLAIAAYGYVASAVVTVGTSSAFAATTAIVSRVGLMYGVYEAGVSYMESDS